MSDALNIAVLIGSGLIAASAVTSLLSQRLGTPLLLIFLGMGLLAGEDGLLGIEFDSGAAAYFIGSLALAIILFDSGFATPISRYRMAGAPALVLATLGVVLTTAFVGVAAHFTFGIDWIRSLMLGAIIGSTDAAAVFFLLRVGGVTIRERVSSTLEIESGANDPMAIFLTATLVGFGALTGAEEMTASALLATFAAQIGLGSVCGVIGGGVIIWFMRSIRDVDAGLYPIAALAAALVVFSATGLLGGSGFLAAYVAGAIAGGGGVPFAYRIRRFQVGMSWLAQIAMFLTLGLLATPSEFGAVLWPAVSLTVVLIFIARPLAVWLCLLPFDFNWREKTFIGWVGLRGAVSILLAILPGLGGVPGGSLFFNTVFIMVIASLTVQGWTIPFAARRLRLLAPPSPGLVDRVALELPGEAEIELVGYRIHPESAVAGGERVPRWARPLLILRGGRTYSVHDAGPLQPKDHVYLFATPAQVRLLDRVYTRPGDLDDRDIFGDFALKPETTIGELEQEYGLELGVEPERTLGDILGREFYGQPTAGDRMSLGPVELVVRAVGASGEVAEIGLVVEPTSRSVLPGWLLALWARLRSS
ncbi:MAG TPA: potassium/proton antiporter [Paracoccaceae bacterium]|nr:potassium/proton antiporter [Paracoccaceae bacterium]